MNVELYFEKLNSYYYCWFVFGHLKIAFNIFFLIFNFSRIFNFEYKMKNNIFEY